jgi:putative transposase
MTAGSRKISRKETKLRRQNQVCKTYQLKIDKSKLNQKTKQHLKSLFNEYKWLYNHMLADDDIFNFDTKIKDVIVKTPDGDEERSIPHVSSQMKQGLNTRMVDAIKSLSAKKKKGQKVGKLKFKSQVNTVFLKQYGYTHKLIDNKFVKIQGIKQKLRVNGLKQIPHNAELTTANLVRVGDDYYIRLTCFLPLEEKQVKPDAAIGIDFGCSTQLTLSTGDKVSFEVPVSKKLRKLDKKLSKQKKRSNNYNKTKQKREKEYKKITNRKNDIRHKIVSALTNNFSVIAIQDENVKGWHKGRHGKKIQSTAIGGIISDLRSKSETVIVDRFFASTQLCHNCGSKQKIHLWDRVYDCPNCGQSYDRDVNAAMNILLEGMKQIPYEVTNEIPSERREFTPAERETSLQEIFSNISCISLTR